MKSNITINTLLSEIQNAEKNGLAHHAPEGILTGFSGEKLVGSLQRLVAAFAGEPDCCYLEVGVFQGLTLLSTASANPGFPCYGIDNFAFFDPESKNKSIVLDRRERLGASNAILIDEDYEDALEGLARHLGPKKVAVYFVDGPHDYRSQRVCLDLVTPYLHQNAVIIVDDSNYAHVRQANRDFLVANPEYKLLFDGYSCCHPKNMDQQTEDEARHGWWNGVNIIVKDPNNDLTPMFPPTERDRSLFENDHILHASRLAQQIPDLIQFSENVISSQTAGQFKTMIKFWSYLRKIVPGDLSDPFRHMNTRSASLPASRFNSD